MYELLIILPLSFKAKYDFSGAKFGHRCISLFVI